MSIIGPTSYSHQFSNYQLGDLTQAMDYKLLVQECHSCTHQYSCKQSICTNIEHT
jgi:hypothetical protein